MSESEVNTCSKVRMQVSDMDLLDAEYKLRDEQDGLRALQTILSFASDIVQPPYDMKPSGRAALDAEVIRLALSLCLQSTTVHHLSGLPIVKACIRIMATSTLPFSDQFGWHCLRLLAISINLTLLEHWGIADATLTTLQGSTRRLAAHDAIAVIIAQHARIKLGTNIGSNAPKHTAQPGEEMAFPPEDIGDLFTLLWNHRKQFLQIMSEKSTPTSLPALSGVFFALRQFVTYQQQSGGEEHWVDSNERLYELSCRYLLVADLFQRSPVLLVLQAILDEMTIRGQPRQVDSEDARSIMSAFTKHLVRSAYLRLEYDPAPFPALALGPWASETISQDLLPEAFRCTLGYAWSLQLDRRTNDLDSVVSVMVVTLINFLYPNRTKQIELTSSTRLHIIEIIRDGELLNWFARAIICVDPQYLLATDDQSLSILDQIVAFLATLLRPVKEETLKSYFKDYLLDWYKVRKHLRILHCNPLTETSRTKINFYRQAEATWDQILHIVGLAAMASDYGEFECHSPRCSYTYLYTGARFACFEQGFGLYCDQYCQFNAMKYGKTG